jgi:type I restriction enzyme S subunit
VRFGDVVRQVKETVDPESGDVARYVAGEHMETDDLTIHRWGDVGSGYLGPAFHCRFRPGQILYGSRRTYLRKVAVADFDGVCANTTFVCEPWDPNVLSPRFLPWVMTSEPFHAFSIVASKGSVNPYVNWSDLARFEFDLPPLVEQLRIADLLQSVEISRAAFVRLRDAARIATEIWVDYVVSEISRKRRSQEIGDLMRSDRPLCYGVVQPGTDTDDGVPLLRVNDLESGQPSLASLRHISRDVDDSFRRSRLAPGDVVVSVVGTIGRTWMATPDFEGVNIARALARLSFDKDTVDPAFVRLVLASSRYRTTMERAAFESARKTLNLSTLAAIKIPTPNIETQRDLVRNYSDLARGEGEANRVAKSSADLRREMINVIAMGTES